MVEQCKFCGVKDCQLFPQEWHQCEEYKPVFNVVTAPVDFYRMEADVVLEKTTVRYEQ